MTDLVRQALAALQQKNYAGARASITEFAMHNAFDIQHYSIKGLAELSLEDWQAAADTFTKASEAFPDQAQFWFNLATAQENLGLYKDSVVNLKKTLALEPTRGEAYGNLSNIYRRLGHFTDAENMAHCALKFGAPRAQSLNTLGLALGKQGKFNDADKAFTEAALIEPKNADIIANRANCAIDQLDFTKAWPLFAAARYLNDKAVIRRDEGMARLLAGDTDKGWPLYEARLEIAGALRLKPSCPLYRGENLADKKILLLAEQGFGDTIMFCRYGKYLAATDTDIVWVVQPPLKSLLAGHLPGQVFTENETLPATDFYLPLLSLPLVLNKTNFADRLPPPYLRSTKSEPRLPAAGKSGRKIGLVWAGSATHERDQERSLPLKQLLPLLWKIDAQFYAPFLGTGLEQITAQTPVISCAGVISDFADSAALLTQLECLISVDTAVAHLAGALGVKTYLLLPHCPDWRWGTGSETTGWYASMTILRQPAYGDWESVVNRLIDRLS